MAVIDALFIPRTCEYIRKTILAYNKQVIPEGITNKFTLSISTRYRLNTENKLWTEGGWRGFKLLYQVSTS